MHLSHSSLARCARDPVCGGTVWIESSSWLSWYRGILDVAHRLPVVVRFPAVPRVRLKTVDPPKGNGLGQKKNCGGTVWIAGVPSALRNALSGISELGREATTDATRKKSLSLTSLDRCVMSNSESIHIWCNVKPVFGFIYHLFQTALWAHWGALRLISTRYLFMSYSLSKSSSSCGVCHDARSAV